MKHTWQVILAGAGGQGLVLGGVLLGEAASVYGGRNALQTQSYGIASRGGFSRSEIVISDSEIIYPGVLSPDVVMVLTQEALEMYEGHLPDGSLLIVEEDLGSNAGLQFPLERTARELGNPRVQNIVGLGVILGITEMIPAETMMDAIKARFGGKPAVELNMKAFEAGFKMGKEANVGVG